jgi:hypothetical protein
MGIFFETEEVSDKLFLWIEKDLSAFDISDFKNIYRAFHGLGKAKFAYGGLILGSNQFTLLPQLSLKMTLDLKVVKVDLKVIISLH